MKAKFTNAKRYATTAVAVADKASVAWTVWVTANAVVVWGVQMFFSAPAMTAANDNEAKPFVAAESALMQPSPQASIAAEPAARKMEFTALPLSAQTADPARAVWGYLCGHNAALGDAAQQRCPASAESLWQPAEQNQSFDAPARTDPFVWSERLNAANDNHHIVEE